MSESYNPLAEWLEERVRNCDHLAAAIGADPDSGIVARADAFREALEMLWELSAMEPVCRVCGAAMGRSRSGRLTCSVACRVALSRRKPEAK
jgi:hypothetical protein